jgi:hypothetical protein
MSSRRDHGAGSSSASELVEQLGSHPATSLGLDLEAGGDRDLARWLVLSVLLGRRTSERAACDAWRRLEKEGLADPDRIARAGAGPLPAGLEAAGLGRSEATAALLVRVSASLTGAHLGSIERLAAASEDLEDLAGRLSGLASGFGRAAVLRFLTPLRERFPVAADLPSTPAARVAATHLGILAEGGDEEALPAVLARWLASGPAPADVPRRDVEAALDRLGRAACLRERRDRCPLAERCPRR